jgi:N-methylhydantoinase B
MRFSDNGYYIERYVKCDNCGILIYDDGIGADPTGKAGIYCSEWCIDWAQARHRGVTEPRLPLPRAARD